MVEDLDDLLTIDHFFNDTFCRTDCLLLRHEVARRLAADFSRDLNGNERSENDDQTHPDTVIHHDAQNRGQRDSRDEQLREGLGNHLSQRFDIVRIIRHHITALVRIKVADRKTLHMREEFSADLSKRSLREYCHHLVVDEACKQGTCIQDCQDCDIMHDLRARICPGHSCFPAFLDHSDDILLEDRRQCRDHSIDHNQNDDHRHQLRIVLIEKLDQALDGSPCILQLFLSHANASFPAGTSSAMDSVPCLFWER